MKLMRFGLPGQERPGLIDADGTLRDLSGHVDDIDSRILDDASLARLRNLEPATLPEIDPQTRLGPCVAYVGKLMCIGLNFYDHATETGLPIPAHPILFMTATSSISGPNDDIVRPRNATHIDWEVELGVVIGKQAKYVTENEALDYVAGYCVVNDLSERYFQMHLTGQWTKGKSCDGFGPVGPYLLTRDEVSDPQNLDMSVTVNGKTMQNGNSRDMIFSVRQIIAHLSELMTLHPGDISPLAHRPGSAWGKNQTRYICKMAMKLSPRLPGLAVNANL